LAVAGVTLPFSSEAVGVGHNPETFPHVIQPGVVCAEHSPSCIEPHAGQVSENSTQPPRSEHWAVLHKHESWSYLANDPRHFGPESRAGPVNSPSGSCNADVLAGEASRYDINNSSPWKPVKSFHVGPDWERLETSIVLPLRQNGRRVGITFNGAHGSPAKEVPAEYSSTSACEKSQLIQFFSFGCCSAHALRSCLFAASFQSTQASFVSSWRRNTSLPSQ
jgi:hypothetical protein